MTAGTYSCFEGYSSQLRSLPLYIACSVQGSFPPAWGRCRLGSRGIALGDSDLKDGDVIVRQEIRVLDSGLVELLPKIEAFKVRDHSLLTPTGIVEYISLKFTPRAKPLILETRVDLAKLLMRRWMACTANEINHSQLSELIAEMGSYPLTLKLFGTKIALDVKALKEHLQKFSLDEGAFGPHHTALRELIAKWYESYAKLKAKPNAA